MSVCMHGQESHRNPKAEFAREYYRTVGILVVIRREH